MKRNICTSESGTLSLPIARAVTENGQLASSTWARITAASPFRKIDRPKFIPSRLMERMERDAMLLPSTVRGRMSRNGRRKSSGHFRLAAARLQDMRDTTRTTRERDKTDGGNCRALQRGNGDDQNEERDQPCSWGPSCGSANCVENINPGAFQLFS